MNLVKLLRLQALGNPQASALCDALGEKYRVLSYAELQGRVAAVACQLERSGLKPGQTVLLFFPISLEFYIWLLAAFHCGLVVMLVDPSAGRNFIAACCKIRQVDAFVGIRKAHVLRLLIPELRRIKICFHDRGWLPCSRAMAGGVAEKLEHDCADEHPALITFTSGSTGAPKVALRTHGFLLAQHRALAKSLHLCKGEIDLITLPVFALANLASGLCSVLADMNFARPADADPQKIYDQCSFHQVSRCAASPAFFRALLRGTLPPFESIYTGGAPVFPDLLKRLSSALPGAKLVAVYGSTEAEPIADHLYDPTISHDSESGLCAGKVVEDLQCKVIADQWGKPITFFSADDFRKMECPLGTIGEIVVSGDHVLRGYLNGVGDHESKFSVSGQVWHRTGDAGSFDANGMLWLHGRCSAKLFTNQGKTIYPLDVEWVLRRRWPDLVATVFLLHGRNVLVVQQDENVTQQEFDEIIANYGLDRVHFVQDMPMDKRHNAKVDYQALRRLFD